MLEEERQLKVLSEWLKARDYEPHISVKGSCFSLKMRPGTFSIRMNVPVRVELAGLSGLEEESVEVPALNLESEQRGNSVKIPIDMVVMPKDAVVGSMPLLIEAKSAGDFTNPNKRRKEEATKIRQLKTMYGRELRFILFLCGYFDPGYLGYEAARRPRLGLGASR